MHDISSNQLTIYKKKQKKQTAKQQKTQYNYV